MVKHVPCREYIVIDLAPVAVELLSTDSES